MRKFIITLSTFLIFGVGFYVVAVMIWGTYAPSKLKSNISFKLGAYGHIHSRLVEVKSQSNVDLLFLGSSHTYRGFDNRIFTSHGFTSFNLGSSSQTPIQTKLLLERYLSRMNPKKVIYEVYPATLVVDGVESALDLIANDKNDKLSACMALKLNNIKVYNTLLYASVRSLFGIDDSFSEPILKDDDMYISGGYVEKELSHFQPINFKEKAIKVNEQQLKTFGEIISELKTRNIDVMLVYAPIPKVNYERYSNNTYFDSLMSSYAVYHNFNETLQLDDSLHFYDSHHLNQNGVKLFNNALIALLEE